MATLASTIRICTQSLLSGSIFPGHFFSGRKVSVAPFRGCAQLIQLAHKGATLFEYGFGGNVLPQQFQDFGGDGTALAAGAFAERFVEIIGDIFDVKRGHRERLGKAQDSARNRQALVNQAIRAIPGIALLNDRLAG